ncbi:MAG: signal recognition particle-docking protein FtsY [Nanoarchaeota archaeon]|nr:signal recognition particle-docking protein FtsY [Nanoarchaeota archaeon]MBU1004522.1 signal recognition particle-docking protein FtsY [Nanoarchaeota archaeon]MBU1945941.1 signal recognition particle-docking protein FtsY [Nanoarchaeota archaeon]
MKKPEPEVKHETPKVTEELKKEEIKKIKPPVEQAEEEIKQPEPKKEEAKPEIEHPIEEIKEEPQEKKGFFQSIKEKITTKKIDKEHFEKIFWELEMVLLENNVAVEVIEKIRDDLSQEIVDKPLPRGKIEDTITHTLKTSIEQLLNVDSFNILEKIKEKSLNSKNFQSKPFVICFVGINGSGKTTTIAKTANLMLKNNLSVVIAAADTFRAASIEQLQIHADKLGVKLIKHNYGSDPAAVAFDAVKHAQSKNIDIVLIDTAGRQHSNANLVDEMKKIIRVAKPDLKIFIGESITGNDCVEQAKKFDEAIGIDAIILSKADIDEKGGAAISVSYVTQKPIVYIGTGQNYEDLKEFDPDIVMNSLGLV